MIRLASEEEALIILNEPETIKRLGIVTQQTLYQPWIAEKDNHQMLFFFWLNGESTYEVHIASPKKSIIYCRKLAIDIIDFLFFIGAKKIITSCQQGKISNMAKKIGMKKTHTDQNKYIWFEIQNKE